MPGCDTIGDAESLALFAGGASLILQVSLVALFRSFGGKFKEKAGFFAHQIIAFVFMCVLFIVGSLAWFGDSSSVPANAYDRVYQTSSVARWLAGLVLGELVLWDIPCGFLCPSLQDTTMLIHHFLMAFVAWAGVYKFPCCYYLFFFGFVELSSIPLAIVDIFHPKNGLNDLLTIYPPLASLNEIAKVSFALLFMLVRALYFPYVVGTMLLPDIVELIPSATSPQALVLGAIAFASSALTLLQLYWAKLVMKNIRKALGGEKKSE